MVVSAAEIEAGGTLVAGGGIVDVVSAALSETGVGAVVLVGSLAATAEGALVAELGLTTAASSAIYFAKDLNDFQSSGERSNLVSKGNIDDLPENAQEMYGKYDESGWKGSVSGQTPGTSSGSKYLNRDGKLPTMDGAGNSITYKEFDVNNKLPNADRDAQRFIVGSDGSIYYTDDHYLTFIEIE